MPAPTLDATAPVRLIGAGLRGAFTVVGALRTGLAHGRSLHPRGQVADATLVIEAAGEETGVALLDRPGSHACRVRISRAVGLPAPVPDIWGLAIRVPDPATGRDADLLVASTGLGVATRHVLLPRIAVDDGALTSLLPVATAGGPLLLSLTPVGAPPGAHLRFELSTSRPGGAWTRRGFLEVAEPGEDDPELRFDPVRHAPAGVRQYGVVRRLREPSYPDPPQTEQE
ncbi:hypothetical protein [Nocardioides pacificus]